MYEMHGN